MAQKTVLPGEELTQKTNVLKLFSLGFVFAAGITGELKT